MERSLRAQISRGLPPEFYSAHESYWQLAKSWSDSVSRQLKSKFEDYAESYRAQAEQLLGERQITEVETRNIQESLRRIRARGSSTSALIPEDSGSEMKARTQ